MLRLFLSHSSADGDLARLIKAHLEETGRVSVYLAELDVQPGSDLAEKIKREIASSDESVALFTRNALLSPYMNQEVGFALRGGQVIPLVEKGIDARTLGMLQGREYIEYDSAHPDEGLSHLNAFVRARLLRKEQAETLALIALTVLLFVLAASQGSDSA